MTRKFLTLMALNACGILVYLALASRCWIEPELADVPGASGGAAFVWCVTAVPVVVAFFIFDVVWLCAAGRAYLETRTWKLHPIFWLLPIIWAAAIYLDFSRHGM